LNTVIDIEKELLETQNHALLLEADLAANPTTQVATELAATEEVIRRLTAKRDAVQRMEDQRREAEYVQSLEVRYAELCVELSDHYKRSAEALSELLEASENGFKVKSELRRTWAILEKRGAYPGSMPDSFWPRHPDLRNRFTDSVLRNGEP
jgi:hypothetical protein